MNQPMHATQLLASLSQHNKPQLPADTNKPQPLAETNTR